MAFTGLGTGTEIDPFQITSISEFREMNDYGSSVSFKLMNDLDFGGTNTVVSTIAINAFASKLDGNNKTLSGLATGGTSKGFLIQNGCSVKDITFRISNRLDNFGYLFSDATTTLDNVVLTNIKIVTSGSGALYCLSRCTFNSTCTLDSLVLEGNIIGTLFSGTIKGLITNIKLLRIGNFVTTLGVALISTLDGELKYSQHIVLGSITNNLPNYSNGSFIVLLLSSSAKITECFYDINGVIFYTAPGTSVAHGFVGISNTWGSDSEVKDCYAVGSFSVNGGEKTTEPGSGKSGFIITANNAVNINRCVASVNIDSPLNDNRPVFSKESAESYTNNCFYKLSALTSITPLDVAYQQTGLTDEQFVNSESFTGFDFINVWEMSANGPVLVNNPRYAFEADKAVTITSVTWQSGTSFDVSITPENTTDFGIEIYKDAVLIDTQSNQLTSTITVDEADSVYVIKSFYIVGGATSYSDEYSYSHFVYEIAFADPELIETTDVTLTTADYVHGSLIFGGYIYGVTRGIPFPTTHGKLVKTPLSDISSFELIDIKATDTTDPYTSETYSKNMEQIIECGGYLYFIFYVTEGGKYYLCQFNPEINDYKVFELPSIIGIGSAPILTDGTFLYLSTLYNVYKISASKFINELPKYNTYEVFPEVDATYGASSQGGHILGGYSELMKGQVHSATLDSEYLYLAYTTRGVGESASGYSVDYDVATCELHKVRISDMSASGWIKIPKSTDDCTQNDTHLFYGIEIASNADIRSYGYGWGNYAVRKSDLRITALPRYCSLDNPPVTGSYGAFIFGKYLVEIKTNRVIYVLNPLDADNWSIDEPIGKRLITSFRTVAQLNELLLAPDKIFYAFGWSAPSQLMKLNLQMLDYHLRIKVAIGSKNTYSGDQQVSVFNITT